jgi:hypothetical protein
VNASPPLDQPAIPVSQLSTMWYVLERNLFKRGFRLTFFGEESKAPLPVRRGTLIELSIVVDDGDDGK